MKEAKHQIQLETLGEINNKKNTNSAVMLEKSGNLRGQRRKT